MGTKSFDILVAKEFSVELFDGTKEKRTAWNKVGRAWKGKQTDSIGFELFLFPGQNTFCKWARECKFDLHLNRLKLLEVKMIKVLILGLLVPALAFASVESSLEGLKSVLLTSILPVFAVMGISFAAFSFFTGNPNAKQHLAYAATGTVILFGAQSIVDLIQRVVK